MTPHTRYETDAMHIFILCTTRRKAISTLSMYRDIVAQMKRMIFRRFLNYLFGKYILRAKEARNIAECMSVTARRSLKLRGKKKDGERGERRGAKLERKAK